MKQYLLFNLISVDQLINTLLGGHPDETLSSRAYRTEQQNKYLGKLFRPLIDYLLWFDKNHCKKAYFAEISKLQLPDNMVDLYR